MTSKRQCAIHPWPRERGVTIIELMVSLVVLAILLAVAVPSFDFLIMKNRLGSYASGLNTSVILARSEAIKRNRTIQLCASSNGTSCATSSVWSSGWIVVDPSATPATVLQASPAAATNYTVYSTGNLASLSFPSSGVGVTPATFKICRSSPVGSTEYVVTVSASGQVAVTTQTSSTCP